MVVLFVVILAFDSQTVGLGPLGKSRVGNNAVKLYSWRISMPTPSLPSSLHRLFLTPEVAELPHLDVQLIFHQ